MSPLRLVILLFSIMQQPALYIKRSILLSDYDYDVDSAGWIGWIDRFEASERGREQWQSSS